jgi:hypothetical protein
MHGLPKYFHWIILFAHTIILRTVTSLGVTGAFYFDYGGGAVMRNSDFTVVFAILWLHLNSLSAFNFFIGTYFNSGTNGEF